MPSRGRRRADVRAAGCAHALPPSRKNTDMLIDKQNLFDDARALLLGAAATALSTNTIDLRATGTTAFGAAVIADFGRGTALELVVQVVTTFTSGGAATLEVELVMADDAALTTNLTVLQATGDIALATLVAGYQFRLSSVPHGITKRYLGLRYRNDSAAAFTAGAVSAFLAFDRQSNPSV